MTSRVRPIDVEPEPPRRGAFLVAAAVVALAGFGFFLANGNLSVSVPTTTTDPPTTTTSTTPPTAAPDQLRDLVPGFQGNVRAVLQAADRNPKGWLWASGDPEPRLVDLPPGSFGSWAPDRALLAAIGGSSFGSSLYFGPPTNIREVFNGVDDFVWHTTQPAALAFVTIPQSDGMRELWRSLPSDTTATDGTFSASRVMRFGFEAKLVAYGDWGFAMESISPGPDPVELSTFDPEGNLIATAPTPLAADFGDGRLLVVVEPESASARLATVDTSLELFEIVGVPDGAAGGLISPNRQWMASVALWEAGAILHLINPDERLDRVIRLGTDVAVPAAWSSDGRWILLVGSPDAPVDSDSTQLIFVQTTSEEISVVTAEGILSGFTLEATGGPGPNSFSLP